MPNELLIAGKYDFFISYCDVDYVGKTSGKPCIKLCFTVNHHGEEHKVYEYLTKVRNPDTGATLDFIQKKSDDLFKAIGSGTRQVLLDDIKNSDLVGKRGSFIIKVEEPTEEYGASNRVARFCPAKQQELTTEEELSDSIPF